MVHVEVPLTPGGDIDQVHAAIVEAIAEASEAGTVAVHGSPQQRHEATVEAVTEALIEAAKPYKGEGWGYR